MTVSLNNGEYSHTGVSRLTSQLEKISSHILSEFDTGRLIVPSLPEVIYRIRDTIRDENKGTRQVAKLIQLDPGLTARLIQIANSPSYRSYFPIDSCQMAVTRLGLKLTRNLVTCLVMHNIFKFKSKSLYDRVKQLWHHSCQVAAISFVLAELHKGRLEAEKALLAGLVHDIGTLPILHYVTEFPDIVKDDALIDQLISRLRGPLGRKILEKWNFNQDLIEVPEKAEDWLRDTGTGIDYVDLVIVAQVHSYFGTPTDSNIPPLLELPAFNKMTIAQLGPDASIELLHGAHTDIRDMVNILMNS